MPRCPSPATLSSNFLFFILSRGGPAALVAAFVAGSDAFVIYSDNRNARSDSVHAWARKNGCYGPWVAPGYANNTALTCPDPIMTGDISREYYASRDCLSPPPPGETAYCEELVRLATEPLPPVGITPLWFFLITLPVVMILIEAGVRLSSDRESARDGAPLLGGSGV